MSIVYLLKSDIYRGNVKSARANASLIYARTPANSIYWPLALQSALDLQSAMVYAEDKDYTTAYSYFFEALESLSTHREAESEGQSVVKAGLSEGQTLNVLRHILLCRVMLNLPEDVNSLLTTNLAARYAEMREVGGMRAPDT